MTPPDPPPAPWTRRKPPGGKAALNDRFLDEQASVPSRESAAPIDLRSRLPQRFDPASPEPPRSSAAFGAVLRYGSLLVAAGAVAGVVGYLAAGARGVPPRSDERSAVAAVLPAVQQLPGRDAAPAAITPPVNAFTDPRIRRPAADDNNADSAAVAAAAPAAPWPMTPPPPAAYPAAPPPAPPEDPAETAEKLRLGKDLLAAGDIAAARTMFERVAEAGNADGAFALAETYDPAVLGAMRMRGGIAPDLVKARRWYERARDLGSSAAPARITRLTGR